MFLAKILCIAPLRTGSSYQELVETKTEQENISK